MSDRETRVILREIKSKRSPVDPQPYLVEAEFLVVSDEGQNVFVSTLEASRSEDVWTVNMSHPLITGKTITATAHELADWMERMAEAIKGNTFDEININNL